MDADACMNLKPKSSTSAPVGHGEGREGEDSGTASANSWAVVIGKHS